MIIMTQHNNTKLTNIPPSFKDAQALFCSYSTLQSNIVLENSLMNILDTEILNSFSSKNSREIFNEIILKYYPNELSVKTNFINQILFRSNKHVTVFELPIGRSRIDLCKLNGSSVAYEIKTDLDTLHRLDKQLNDYLEIFEEVFVICSINKLHEIEKQIIPSCGIYTYSISKKGNYKFQLFKHATSSVHLNSKKQLDILRKQELIKNFTVNPFLDRKDITSLILQEYSPNEINQIFKQLIKARYQDQWDFLKNNRSQIFEIDYQWFFKNTINPDLIYN
jgi:hypothetical protein